MFCIRTSACLLLLFFSLVTLSLCSEDPEKRCEDARYEHKHRVFICTDISNEPDDQMSLVRFLTYANELDIQGIAVVTSVWKNDSIDLPTTRQVIEAYGNVTANLNANVPSSAPYPSGSEILSKVHAGHPVYGLAALELELSDAAQAMVEAADGSSDNDPLWVCFWGGANVLAEALNHVSQTRDEQAVASFVRKLRVYGISDQDNAGAWIREQYPQIFFIVSLHGFSEYTQATWTGISGEVFRHFDIGGPDSSLVTNEWLQEHIRVGQLGAQYPNYTFIMEGDTPSFFPLIQNGLGDPEHPEWGSWGGRYILLDASGVSSRTFSNAADVAVGQSGDLYVSAYASIWRWRKAYQHDFAARMAWTLSSDYPNNNHFPVAIVNGSCGPEVIRIPYNYGESLVLDASKSWDPDGDDLKYDWFHYREVIQRIGQGETDPVSQNVSITSVGPSGGIVRIQPLANLVRPLQTSRNRAPIG